MNQPQAVQHAGAEAPLAAVTPAGPRHRRGQVDSAVRNRLGASAGEEGDEEMAGPTPTRRKDRRGMKRVAVDTTVQDRSGASAVEKGVSTCKKLCIGFILWLLLSLICEYCSAACGDTCRPSVQCEASSDSARLVRIVLG